MKSKIKQGHVAMIQDMQLGDTSTENGGRIARKCGGDETWRVDHSDGRNKRHDRGQMHHHFEYKRTAGCRE